MPKYRNRFVSPDYVEHRIADESGKLIGTLRVKPVAVLWKPRGKREFFSVGLNGFVDWITDPATKAKKTKL